MWMNRLQLVYAFLRYQINGYLFPSYVNFKYLNTCFFYRQSEQNTQQGATGVLWVWSSRKDLCLLAMHSHAIIFISLFFLFRGQFSSFEIENELTLDI